MSLTALAIRVDGPKTQTYNPGDKITVLFSYTDLNASTVDLTIYLTCDNLSQTIKHLTIDLTKSKVLSQDITLPEIQGACKIIGNSQYLEGETSVSETTEGNDFNLTQNLEGTVILDRSAIQLGQTIRLNASITRASKAPSTGLAQITVVKGTETYYIDSIGFSQGKIEYNLSSINFPAGEYAIKLLARDINGNQFESSDLPIKVTDEINVVAYTDKLEYLPGDFMNLNGTIISATGTSLKNVVVAITINNNTLKNPIRGSSFLLSIKVPSTIKSGENELIIDTYDDFRNKGRISLQFNVRAVPTLMMLEMPDHEFFPGDNISVTPYLYDQASNFMVGSAVIKIIDAKNNLIFNRTDEFGNRFSYTIPAKTPPGEYSITAYSNSLAQNTQFTVKPLEAIHVELKTDNLTLTNIGNIQYAKRFEFQTVDSKGKLADQGVQITFNPGESRTVELSKMLAGGNYSIIIPQTYNQEEKHYDNISITDERSFLTKISGAFGGVTGYAVISPKSKSSNSLFFLLLVLLLVVIVISLIYWKSAGKQFHQENIPTEIAPDQTVTIDDKAKVKPKLSDWVAQGHSNLSGTKTEPTKKVLTQEESDNLAAAEINKRIRENRQHTEEASKRNDDIREDPNVKAYIGRVISENFKDANNPGLEDKVKHRKF